MAQRITELRAARGVSKRQMTILERFLDAITPATSIFLIEARHETINTIRDDFETAQKELERLDPTETAEPDENQLTEREAFENRFVQVKARFQQLLRENPESSFHPQHNSTLIDIQSDLPKFDIPDFHGEYEEYNTFMDIFDTLIHRSPVRTMTNVRKLGYLKGACKDRAYDVIKHLPLTNENYEVARDMLKTRFSNPRLSFQECIDKIWKAPQASSAKSLRTVSDLINSQLRALERLGTKEQISNGILIHLTVTKFDTTTKSKWEENLAASTEIPSWETLTQFLNKRCTVWEAIEASKPIIRSPSFPTPRRVSPKRNYSSSSSMKCVMCQGKCPNLAQCSKFMELPPRGRSNWIRQRRFCPCCLQPRHEEPCEHENCQHCGRFHNTVLHYGRLPTNDEVPHAETSATLSVVNEVVQQHENVRFVNNIIKRFESSYCFLATAVILVKNAFGQYVPLRALLDGAAQSSFITGKAAKMLGLSQISTHVELAGVHGNVKTLKRAVKIEFKSSVNDKEGEFVAVINPFYKDSHPAKFIDTSEWPLPKNIKLADPQFNVPEQIDVLVNAHNTYEWQCMGQFQLGEHKPLLQKTSLGWVVVGNYDQEKIHTHPFKINLVSTGSMQDTMERFWSLEEVDAPAKALTSEEKACEGHFLKHVSRQADGRFVVKLPFKEHPSVLGNSFSIANRRAPQPITPPICQRRTYPRRI